MILKSSETLRALMRQEHISLGQLATKAGCSKGFISHLLSERRRSCTAGLAQRICYVLEVPVTVLFAASRPPATWKFRENVDVEHHKRAQEAMSCAKNPRQIAMGHNAEQARGVACVGAERGVGKEILKQTAERGASSQPNTCGRTTQL